LLHFLNDKEKKYQNVYIYSYCVCYIFFIVKVILIYLLHVLFVLKIEGIFGKRKSQLKRAEKDYFLYI